VSTTSTRSKPLEFKGRHRVSIILRAPDLTPVEAKELVKELRDALRYVRNGSGGRPIQATVSWTDLDDLGTYALRLRRRRVV
jgi:hypothetical protein